MSLFDIHIIVDWSAAGRPVRGANSIWIAIADGSGVHCENPATRAAAMAQICDLLDGYSAANRRAFVGFDFAFGYPEAFSHAFGKTADWRDVWAAISHEVKDGLDNANNRFHAAARLNAKFPGDGPFWGNGLAKDIPGLPRKKPAGWGKTLPPNRRWTDMLARKAQEVWKLCGAGSVGGQALTGIAALERCRHARGDVAIWPFETSGNDKTHVFAEVYPSLAKVIANRGEVKDAAQVRCLATGLAALDAGNGLAPLLARRAQMPKEVFAHEALMLGVETPEVLTQDLTSHPRSAGQTFLEQKKGFTYERQPGAIYKQSFATVEAEADLRAIPKDMRTIVIRLIHACGMIDIAQDLRFSVHIATAAQTALQNGKPILCDCEMVRAGIIRRYLPQDNPLIVTLNDPDVPNLAAQINNTRSAAAVELWRDHLEGAIVAIGNAPTALFHLLELLDAGFPKPACILGFPVGFVGAAESKAELIQNPRSCDFLALTGRRGGSAIASAAVNGLTVALKRGSTA